MSLHKNLSFKLLLLFIVFVLPCVCISCIERNLEAFEKNAGFFSVYGALDMTDDTHYVRVNNVQTPVVAIDRENFNGIVTFIDLETGIEKVLKDTIVNFSGFSTHNFILDSSLEPRHKYQLIVERADGEKSSTEVTTPGLSELNLIPDNNIGCETQIRFTFKNVVKPEQVTMEVGFHHGGEIHWSEIGLVSQLKHNKKTDEMYVSLSPRNLLVDVFPPSRIISTTDPRNILPTVHCHQLGSNKVHIRYTHYGPEWDIYSPGYFPIDPLEWQDVEGGLGFLGAFRQDSTTFTIRLPKE